MSEIREEKNQPVNIQEIKDLHLKYVVLAKDAQKREDLVLSESYYQRAEYYLHAMNYPSDSLPTATPHQAVRQVHSDVQVKQTQEGKVLPFKVLPFRGNFLRRKRGFLPR